MYVYTRIRTFAVETVSRRCEAAPSPQLTLCALPPGPDLVGCLQPRERGACVGPVLWTPGPRRAALGVPGPGLGNLIPWKSYFCVF